MKFTNMTTTDHKLYFDGENHTARKKVPVTSLHKNKLLAWTTSTYHIHTNTGQLHRLRRPLMDFGLLTAIHKRRENATNSPSPHLPLLRVPNSAHRPHVLGTYGCRYATLPHALLTTDIPTVVELHLWWWTVRWHGQKTKKQKNTACLPCLRKLITLIKQQELRKQQITTTVISNTRVNKGTCGGKMSTYSSSKLRIPTPNHRKLNNKNKFKKRHTYVNKWKDNFSIQLHQRYNKHTHTHTHTMFCTACVNIITKKFSCFHYKVE